VSVVQHTRLHTGFEHEDFLPKASYKHSNKHQLRSGLQQQAEKQLAQSFCVALIKGRIRSKRAFREE
jgi:hypothetical protein